MFFLSLDPYKLKVFLLIASKMLTKNFSLVSPLSSMSINSDLAMTGFVCHASENDNNLLDQNTSHLTSKLNDNQQNNFTNLAKTVSFLRYNANVNVVFIYKFCNNCNEIFRSLLDLYLLRCKSISCEEIQKSSDVWINFINHIARAVRLYAHIFPKSEKQLCFSVKITNKIQETDVNQLERLIKSTICQSLLDNYNKNYSHSDVLVISKSEPWKIYIQVYGKCMKKGVKNLDEGEIKSWVEEIAQCKGET